MDKRIISDVVKGIMTRTGTARANVAAALGKKSQGLNDQLTRGSFNGVDLTIIAAACGVRLAFVDNNNNVVVSFPAPELSHADKQKTE